MLILYGSFLLTPDSLFEDEGVETPTAVQPTDEGDKPNLQEQEEHQQTQEHSGRGDDLLVCPSFILVHLFLFYGFSPLVCDSKFQTHGLKHF